MHICKRCGGKTDRIHDYRRSRGARFGAARKARAAAVPSEAIRLPGLQEALFGNQRFWSGAICALPIAPPKKSWNCCAGAAAEGHREGHGDLRQRRETRAGHHACLQAGSDCRRPSPLTNSRATRRPALSVYRRRPSESLRVRHPAGQNRPDHSGISSLLPQPGRSEVRRHD